MNSISLLQRFCRTGLAHDWSRIEGHSCGRYKEDKEREAKKAETDLKRYMHYHTRWKGHMESLRYEILLRYWLPFGSLLLYLPPLLT